MKPTSPQAEFHARGHRLPGRLHAAAFHAGCLTILLGLATAGCGRSGSGKRETIDRSTDGPPGGEITSAPLSDRQERDADAPLFEMVPPGTTRVEFRTIMKPEHRYSLLNHTAFVCGGVCIGDVNRDGRPDLFFANGPLENRLYLQDGDFRFEDVTVKAGVGGGGAWGVGAAVLDVEGDGDLDIYVCNYDSANQLFINDGTGRSFRESAGDFGLDLVDASLTPSCADYDGDGDLDVFVLTYRYYRPGGRPRKPPVGFRDGRPYILPEFEKYYHLRKVGPTNYAADTCGRPDRLFRNNGDGTFTDVSREAGITEAGHGLSATWWDYNDDGRVDLYVGNDFTDPDHLYRNEGDGIFTDVIASVLPSMSWSSMGADCADIDGDGRLDFFSAEMLPVTHQKQKIVMGELGDRGWFLQHGDPPQIMRNHLFLRTGTGRFLEAAWLCGVANTDWTWAPKLADLDNDGRPDLFISNGCARMSNDADVPVMTHMLVGQTEWDIWKDEPPLKEQNLAFRNLGDLRFQDTSEAWGLDHVGMSYSTAHGDLDGDGDLDLVLVNLDEPASIYRNRESAHHRIIVELRGRDRNRWGIGAVVRLETASGEEHIRQMQPMTGYAVSNEPVLHFGLGAATRIRRLTVTWPRGTVQRFEDLETDRRYFVSEPAPDTAEPPPGEEPAKPWFSEVSAARGLSFRHEERPFDDFASQPLLPYRLSRLGSGLAWGDADGDGDEDLYVGGAAGQAGRLFLNDDGEGFHASEATAALFRKDREHEDMAALWIDADSDMDLDLLVTSGGSEHDEGDRRLADRLYLNDGAGRLTRAEASVLPPGNHSTGAAAAADFDGDGDLDLFLGGRVIPGEYPEAPQSRLLRNDGGKFVDATEAVAPHLRRIGLVTAALWSDVDGDGRIDLLVALEWGTVRMLWNTGEKLVDRTAPAGLAERTGWWQSLTGGDFDSDGDTDYLVGNAGLNTQYGAPTASSPALLFQVDIGDAGGKRLIEGRLDAERMVPVRSRPCVVRAVPGVEKTCPTHRRYASATLAQIYGEKAIEEARKLTASCLESGILWNESSKGQVRLTWQPLPRRAQLSPVYGSVSCDLDGDGVLELQLVQNFHSREPRTGPWCGGLGVTLRARGRALEVIPLARTGVVVPGDGRGLATCDLDLDGWPDLTVTRNDDTLLAFRNRGDHGPPPLVVKLRGPQGNPLGVGSRVRVYRGDGRSETAEVTAGAGYLSQSTAALFFGRGSGPIRSVHVVWPDGAATDTDIEEDTTLITVEHPAR